MKGKQENIHHIISALTRHNDRVFRSRCSRSTISVVLGQRLERLLVYLPDFFLVLHTLIEPRGQLCICRDYLPFQQVLQCVDFPEVQDVSD